ncbi:MAG: 4Fe-4S dicluster domain-containing protein [Saprospiraceae bacterium]|nr:4Fe-4S dicluster domain-containing protein [Saprospiraceae bacterium]
MKQNDNVWLSPEDLGRDDKLRKESKQEFFNLPILNDLSNGQAETSQRGQSGRRDFLKYLGFSLGAATVAAACETPVRKAIPYVSKPDAIVPGVATYYASSYVRGGDFCPILIKTREGRPIKIEGNTMSPLAGGGTSARAQASVLDLYDVARLREPIKRDEEDVQVEWSVVDQEVVSRLRSAQGIRIVSHTNISPADQKAVSEFIGSYPQAKQVAYDPISSSGMLQANERNFGLREIPGYRFEQADIIVSFGADFLATWLSPTEFASQFAARRKMKNGDASNMSRFVQFESNMSYTGSNADHRVLVKPSEQGLAIAKLYNEIAGQTGGQQLSISGQLANAKAENAIQAVAEDLVNARGRSLVVSSSNNSAEQSLVNAINYTLGNYGATIDFSSASFQRTGSDQDMAALLRDMQNGAVDAVIFVGDANPAFDRPDGSAFAEAISGLDLAVACTSMPSETESLCDYVCPVPHYLESWGDVRPKRGYYGIVQPSIHPLFNTRAAALSLLTWGGNHTDILSGEQPMYTFIRSLWEEELFPKQDQFATFQAFWDNTLHDGFVEIDESIGEIPDLNLDLGSISSKITSPSGAELEVSYYEPINIGSGQYANNPWLQEMPDPVTRVVWDNVLHIPLRWDGRRRFEYFQDLDEDGILVDLQVGDRSARLPVVRQFGQMAGTVAVALGYGRTVSGKAGTGIGKDCFPMLGTDADGNIQYFSTGSVSGEMGRDERFASVQHHHTLGVTGPDETAGGEIINVDEKAVMTIGTGTQGGLTRRSILRHANVDHIDEAVSHLKEERSHHQYLNEQTLYPDRTDYYALGHHWGMSVDLSACIGCGACQVACVAENNVPVVGKVEVNRHHEMTWMRIDRYYYGDVETPNVVYQPMMCQHCDNAPCENVCPVSATNHSSEGLNQMVYNRCVGTRYCANNCPYKVRRFNWLDYNAADTFPANENDPFDESVPYYADNLTRMVLNPDVTVRSRGVIEKCSMCVQRIQEGKLLAKRENRTLQDGDIKTACQTACPTGAIIFGDMNNHDSELHEKLHDDKNYYVLEETNVRSSVGYLMKVTNQSEKVNSDEA